MYDLAVAGDLPGFNAAMDALPEISPAELDVLHPISVGTNIYINVWKMTLTVPKSARVG